MYIVIKGGKPTIDQTIKDFKIKPKYVQQQFRTAIYLGCSPKFKR